MSKRLSLILVGLVVLTIGGLVLVSNLITSEPSAIDRQRGSGQTGASPRIIPSAIARKSSTGQQRSGDLLTARGQLSQLSSAIQSSEWARAQELISGFELRRSRLPSAQLKHPDVSPMLQDFFDFYVVQLERAIADKQVKQADIALSQLRGIIDETASRFGAHTLPVEIQRLHYLARELVLWKDAGDEQMLQARKIALNEAWNDASALPRTREEDGVATRFADTLKLIMEADNGTKLAPLLNDLATRLRELDALFQDTNGEDE